MWKGELFAVRGAGSIGSTFHNMPVELPPLPTDSSNILLEHAYLLQGL